jgi:hypothetical protein
VKIFDFSSFSALAVLQSCFHVHWALMWGSTTGETPAYVGGSCFDTFPFPAQFMRNGSIFYDAKLDGLDEVAENYDLHRSHICADRQKGFTDIYNLLNSRAEESDDIKKLRELTVIMDHAVAASYGWNDLKLDHDFYEADYLPGKDRSRFTISGTTRREILGRLSELNRERYEQEVEAGLHKAAKKPASRKRQASRNADDLFNAESTETETVDD